jgi:hypothetical protein
VLAASAVARAIVFPITLLTLAGGCGDVVQGERTPWEVYGLRAGMSRAELEKTVFQTWRQSVTCEVPWPPAPACARAPWCRG